MPICELWRSRLFLFNRTWHAFLGFATTLPSILLNPNMLFLWLRYGNYKAWGLAVARWQFQQELIDHRSPGWWRPLWDIILWSSLRKTHQRTLHSSSRNFCVLQRHYLGEMGKVNYSQNLGHSWMVGQFQGTKDCSDVAVQMCSWVNCELVGQMSHFRVNQHAKFAAACGPQCLKFLEKSECAHIVSVVQVVVCKKGCLERVVATIAAKGMPNEQRNFE